MIGISPAYFFSLHGTGFGPNSIMEDLPVLSSMGYEGFQTEIFDVGAVSGWTKEAISDLNSASQAAGMKCTAFVAHFLGSSFASYDALEDFSVNDTVQHAIEAAAGIEGNTVFALPLPAFTGSGDPVHTHYRVTESRPSSSLLSKTLCSLVVAVEASGMQLALELMPGNALGGSTAFLGLCQETSFEKLGLVFDTGHFWAMGEDVASLPVFLGDRIIATHLCDNDGLTKLSLCPCDGAVPFDQTSEGLAASAYGGSLDVEIVCPADKLHTEYKRAVPLLQQMEDRRVCTPPTARVNIRSTP